jgi:hypothetical protein
LGSFVWASAAIGAGLVFHLRIEYVFTVLEQMGRVSLLLLALLIAGYVLAKYLQRRQFLKTLRMARIAKSLMKRGFAHVRPLLGGFDAWIEAGLSVDTLPVAGSAQQAGKSQPCIDNAP